MEKLYVKWLDSVVIEKTGWMFKEDYEELEPSVCETIGFLLSDKNDYITLAQNISDNQLLNIITISKMIILEQETLRFTSQEEMVEDAKETS